MNFTTRWRARVVRVDIVSAEEWTGSWWADPEYARRELGQLLSAHPGTQGCVEREMTMTIVEEWPSGH